MATSGYMIPGKVRLEHPRIHSMLGRWAKLTAFGEKAYSDTHLGIAHAAIGCVIVGLVTLLMQLHK